MVEFVDMKVEYVDHLGGDVNVVNAARTKTHTRILEAVARGYSVKENGELHGPKGRLSVKTYGKQRYPTFSTNWGGYVFGVPVHMFAAYVFYGEEVFKEGAVVRHLNADTTDITRVNIVLGTHSENNLDKSPETRSAAAKKARESQGKRPMNAKLNDEQVSEIREFYKALGGKKAANGIVKRLCEKMGVSRTVLTKIKNGEYYVG